MFDGIMKLKVYSTESCSLCEQVIEKLFGLTHGDGIELTIVDVSLDEDLLSKFGEYLPVLEMGKEVLRSPFDDERMMLFLSTSS